jgi:hypothetical protein
MTLRFLTLLLFTITIIGCKNSSNNPESNNSITIEESSPILKLNNGKKWIANIETHDGVTKMDSIISNFKSNTTEDYFALGEALSEQTSTIIKKCSMKGEPHNQLHVVLVPMLDEISILKESKNKGASQKALQQLEGLIADYFKHFTT